MASKKSKPAPTGEELFAQLDELGGDANEPTKKSTPKPSTSTARGNRPGSTPSQTREEAELLAELDNLAQQPDRPKSRPHTPRTAGASIPPAQESPKRTSTNTPPTTAAATSGASRSSEEKAPVQSRRSGESTRSFHQGFTPDDEEERGAAPAQQEAASGATTTTQSGGGWWGGIVAKASAAVKQAEALAKEIQRNEEAQRWAEQVKGNVGALRSYGESLISMLVSQRTALAVVYCYGAEHTDAHQYGLQSSLLRTDSKSFRQAANYGPAPSPPSPASCTPSPRQSPRTSACRSTSRTT